MYPVGYSKDGAKAILYSLGDLGGSLGAGESALEGVLYLDTRTSKGWTISPMNPPLSVFVGQIPVAIEADSGETLWKQHLPGQSALTRGLYVRSASGMFSFVGPLTPRSEVEEEESNVIEVGPQDVNRPVAATSDYQHVVLLAPRLADLWPFDNTVGEAGSLSEYSGRNNGEPVLVGVDGAKGSTHLIGLCGTELGSGGSGSAYNALSSNGETLFFTVQPVGRFGCQASAPATAEVYARLHGSLISRHPAETINVSANECTTMCGIESGKNFEGASEDGRRVFFTSTQKLTNDAVDGTASGNAAKGEGCAAREIGAGGCNLYEYDFSKTAGERLRLVAGGEVLGVMGIAEDGSRVYFVSRLLLVSGENGKSPTEGYPNLYVYDTNTQKTVFIATLNGGDESDWQRAFQRPAEVAGERGRFLIFVSSMPNLTPQDKSELGMLFEYDAVTKELARVTVGEQGYSDNGQGVSNGIGATSIADIAGQLGYGLDFKSTTNKLNISADGQTVFFETAGRLSPRASSAAENCTSLYEFHSNGIISQGSVHLVSDGRDNQLNKGSTCGAQFQGTDDSGKNVLFSTADPLLPSDTDGVQRDIYDARVEGGFLPLSDIGLCEPRHCEGEVPSTPEFAIPSSAAADGELSTPEHVLPAHDKPTIRKKRGISRAQQFARALKACKSRPAAHRPACERAARQRFRATTVRMGSAGRGK